MDRSKLKKILRTSMTLVCVLALSECVAAQAMPLVPPDKHVNQIYTRLLAQIERIQIFDNHAHPGFPDDPDVDAMVSPPGASEAFRTRASNPELVAAAKAVFGYPFDDFASNHAAWLEKTVAERKRRQGAKYFSTVLDRVGIETCLANRVAMPDYLEPTRFRWVFFVDSFLFPLDNHEIESRNPDLAIYMPLQEKVLHRYMQSVGVAALPEDLAGYESLIQQVLTENQKRGGVAMKFEISYFRPLYFQDPARGDAAAIYKKYRAGGVPSSEEYRTFQDYIFRRLLDNALHLHLPVHFHSAVGIGDYFDLRGGNPLNLENILRDPRYAGITFVLLHGGYPYERDAIWLAAMKNVYLDSSLMELYLYPSEFKRSLKQWLEVFPEKVVFGSDAFPFNDALGAENTFWLASRSVRTSLAAALAEMVATSDVREAKALEMARGYLHDNAAKLYPAPR